MNAIFKYLILPICLLNTGCEQNRENWILAFATPDGDMYYDANSVRDVHGLKVINIKGTMPAQSQENLDNASRGKPIITHTTGEIRIDCQAKTKQFANVTVYYQDGNKFQWPEQSPEQIHAASHTDSLFKLACQ